MPPFERMDRLDKAVLWQAIGVDNYSEPMVAGPVEIDVRWVASQRLMLDKDGNTVAVDATAVVGQDIPLLSIIWLGKLSDLVGETQFPIQDGGLMQVKLMSKTADIKNRNHRRTVGLLRFNDTIPQVQQVTP